MCAGTILLAGPASPQALSFTAKNWAGYVAAPDLTDPQPQAVNTDSVTAVSGSWIVPAVTPSTVSNASWQDCMVWVGIDGFSDQTVEQVGTESADLQRRGELSGVVSSCIPAAQSTS